MRRKHLTAILAASVGAWALHGQVLAQTPQEATASQMAGDTVVYQPDFFQRYEPRTALDMVSRVPGFIVDEGEERRGLSGASGNIRIDGAQPSAKSQSLEDILTRIPAGDVARIELVRGESSGAAGGQTVYVNVVRAASKGEAVYTLGAEIDRDKRIGPQGEASWSRSIGAGMLSVRGAYEESRATERGPRIRYNNAGAVVTSRDETAPGWEKEAQLSGEWTTPLAGGELSLTAQFQNAREKEPWSGITRNGLGVILDQRDGDATNTENTYEAGLSYGRGFGAWSLNINSVLTRGYTDSFESEALRNPAGLLRESEVQTNETNTGESILRGVLSRSFGGAKLEFGAEGAVNTLDQHLTLTEDSGTGPHPVLLPSASVRVEEKRAEAFATLSWAPLPDWKAEATAAAETSTLTQEGDVNLETKLTYWKPSFQVVRSLGEKNQLRVRLHRDIGQLDFEDFVAASELVENTVSAGNPDLKPETSWRLEAAGDFRFGQNGAFEAKVFRWWVDDALDQIPFGPPGARFDAPGNIGQADVYGATISFTLPLSAVIPGAQVSGEVTAQKSEATDPLTRARRSLSDFQELAGQIDFRQDLPAFKFAWGATYEEQFEVTPTFRLNETRTEGGNERWEIFAESNAIDGLKLRGWLKRLNGPPRYRYRNFFTPDRLGAPNGRETAERYSGLGFGLSVTGSF
jgi:hypothetical protein